MVGWLGGWMVGCWVVGILESSAELNSKLRLKLKFELSLAKNAHVEGAQVPKGCGVSVVGTKWPCV